MIVNVRLEKGFGDLIKFIEVRFDVVHIVCVCFVTYLDKSTTSFISNHYQHLLIAQHVKEYPKTQKNLIHQFNKYVGLSPKYYQRILRFNAILRILNEKEINSWAELACMCGYADQSHFIKEFKFFSSFKPGEFSKRKADPTNPLFFLPVDLQEPV